MENERGDSKHSIPHYCIAMQANRSICVLPATLAAGGSRADQYLDSYSAGEVGWAVVKPTKSIILVAIVALSPPH